MRPTVSHLAIVAVLLASCDDPSASARCNADSECEDGARCRDGVCGVDDIAPGRVVDLAVDSAATTAQSLTLAFTAPGDDGFALDTRPDRYVVHATPEGDGAEQTVTLDASALAGQPERLVVEGLFRGTRYSVSVEAVDAANNASLSNTIATETGGALCLEEDGELVARGNVFRVTRPEHLVRLVGCERIEATLLIEDVDCVIESLAALTSLTSVTALTISGNALCGTGLVSLEDLAALESGDVSVTANGTLTSIELPALAVGTLLVTDNPVLDRVAAPVLAQGSVTLSRNNRLGDVDLTALVAADSIIVDATAPLDVDLPALATSTFINLSGDVALSMPLTDVAGTIVVRDGVRALSLPELRTITGAMSFEGAALPELTWALERIDGSLTFIGVDDAIELPATLTEIAGALSVQTGDVSSLSFDALITGSLSLGDLPALSAIPPLRLQGAAASLAVTRTSIASIDATLAGAQLSISDNGGAAPSFFGGGGVSFNDALHTVVVRGDGALTVLNNAGIALDADELAASSFTFSRNSGAGEVRVRATAALGSFGVDNNSGFTSVVLDDASVASTAVESFFLVEGNVGLVSVVIEPSVLLGCGGSMRIDGVATATFDGARLDVSCVDSFFINSIVLINVSTFAAPNMTTATVTTTDAFGLNGGVVRLNGAAAQLPALTSITANITNCFGGGFDVPFFAGASSIPAQPITVNGCANITAF